jgi:glycosyltransferase involved in cell wall biosynthesis
MAYFLRAFPKLSETFILGEILALKRLGVDVRVVALEAAREPRRHPEAESLLPEVTFVPEGMVSFPPRLRARAARRARPGVPPADHRDYWRAGEWAAGLLDRWGAEHIHAHFAGPAATMAAGASARTGIPFSFTAHAKDIFSEHVNWTWVTELGRRAHAVVTVCDYNRRFLAERLPDARLLRIYNGIDLERWRPSAARTVANTIVSVGRLVPKKGFHVLIEAVAVLRRWGVPATATIIGEGVERERLQESIRARGLVRWVRLRGGLSHAQVRHVMRRAHIVAAPSVVEEDGNQDALPTVLLEAGACGVPAVATRVAGIPEIVRHGRTGIVVPPDDPGALARAMRRLLESPATCDALGRAARAWIAHRFDQRRAVARLARLFAEGAATAASDRKRSDAGLARTLLAAPRRA